MEYHFANGKQGDPAVIVHSDKTGKKFAFDLGSIESLSQKEIIKIRHAFITHTHIDHFYGFDRLLRTNVPHGKELEISGPKGIINNVYCKLNGYLWNLVEPGQVKYFVHEIEKSGAIKTAQLSCEKSFKPELISWQRTPDSSEKQSEKPVTPVTTMSDNSVVRAVVLDHGTPCCAYTVESPVQYKVREEALSKLSLIPGPWIRDLQQAVSKNDLKKPIKVDRERIILAEKLACDVLSKRKPKLVAYMTDFIFSWENITRIGMLARNSELLICESSFLDDDKVRAFSLKHLTTKQAALVAAWANVENLETFHYSNIYGSTHTKVEEEGKEFFARFKNKQHEELRLLIDDELCQCQ